MLNEETPSPSSLNVFKLRKTELARLLDVSDETIANYTKAGMPVSGKGHSARYVLSQCVQYVIQFEAGKLVRSKKVGSEDMEALELRHQLATTQQAEYKAAKVMGETVTLDDAEREMSKRLEPVRAKLLAIPGSWAPQITGLKAIPDAVDVLSDLVYRLMDEVSNPQQDDDDETDAVEAEDVEVVEEIDSDSHDT
jgi:phage terminase Nu1 subunit (DNA packaging protein)